MHHRKQDWQYVSSWMSFHLVCSSHAADNTGCFRQDRRARLDALVAKRKAYLLGCGLLTLQDHAHIKKQLMHKAHHFHRLNVLREGVISLRSPLQVSDYLHLCDE